MTLITKYWERIAQLLILCGVIATLWLNSRYLTIQQYNADSKEVRTEMTTRIKDTRNESIAMYDKVASELNTFAKDNAQQHILIQASIVDIATALKVMAANQTQIADHEQRIRLLSERQIDVMSRLSAIEKQ